MRLGSSHLAGWLLGSAMALAHPPMALEAQQPAKRAQPINLDAEAAPGTELGWSLGTDRDSAYVRRLVADTVFAGAQAIQVASLKGPTDRLPFGAFNQVVDAVPYRGKRVQFQAVARAALRSTDSWGALWIRVDKGQQVLALENMMDHPITDTAWQVYRVEVYVASNATSINIGGLLYGKGALWIDEARLVAIDEDTPAAVASPASTYLDSTVSLVRQHAIAADAIDWSTLLPALQARIQGATSTRDAYPAIRLLLQALGDGHSTFIEPGTLGPASQVPGPMAKASPGRSRVEGRLVNKDIGYVAMFGLALEDSSSQVLYATETQSTIAKLARKNVCGWVIDLRENVGGNMWPMLAGIGPLLGEGVAGTFIASPHDTASWGYWDGKAMLRGHAVVQVQQPIALLRQAPVAVLTSRRTASSGEAVLQAFRGRDRTRTFGRPTRGLASANEMYVMPDSAIVNLTIALTGDRSGRTYPGPIPPDVLVPADTVTSQDGALDQAIAWLDEQRECRQ